MILKYSSLKRNADIPAKMNPVESEGFKFVQEYWDHKAKYPAVLVDVAKIDKAWSSDKDMYIGPGGTGNNIKTRYPDFQQWLKDNPETPIIMPNLGWSEYNENITFGNGRHRFSVLRDMGVKKIWVTVPTEQLKLFKENFT